MSQAYTYQVESFSDVINEIKPLLHAHFDEIATNKELKPLDPDYDRYEALEDLNMLRIMTVRFSGTLIGYFVVFLIPHIHYQQTNMAMNDILYLAPEYRGGTVGYRLIKKSIEDLKEMDVDILTIHMKVDYPFRELLTKFGFHKTEENWDLVL